MATRMQQRRGTATQWTTADPILAPGEIGFESDTNQFKIGDGINHWSDLSYFKNLEDLGGSLDDYVLISTKGQAGGVASLNEDGVIPSEQIPSLVGLDTEITTAVNNAVSSLVDSAPGALNTLNELAAAINDDANYAVTVVTAIDELTTAIDDHKDAPTGVHGVGGSVVGTSGPQTLTDKTISGADNTITNILKESVTDLVSDLSSLNTTLTSTQEGVDALQLTTLGHTESISTLTSDLTALTGTTDGLVEGIALKADIDSPTFTGTVVGITKAMVGLGDVDNTTDANKPVSTATQTALDAKAPIDAPTFTGTVSGITKSMVGLSDADNTSDLDKPVSTATQAELDLKADASAIDEAAQEAVNAALTAGTGITKTYDDVANTITLEVDTTEIQVRVADVSDAEIGHLNGVVSSIQDQLDAKLSSSNAATTYAPIDSPTFTGTVTLPNNTISQSMMGDDSVGTNEIGGLSVTNEKLAGSIGWDKLAISSTVSSTEAGYLAGVTSAVQTQLNDTQTTAQNAAIVAGAIDTVLYFSGSTGQILTKNSSSEPTYEWSTLDLSSKADLAGATFTGDVTVETDLIVDGNLTISGTTTTVSTANFTTEDALIYIGEGNSANLLDLGFVSSFNDGTYQHSGLVRDASAGTWKLFKGVTDEPTTTINFAQGSLDDLAVGALTATSASIGDVSNTELQYLNGVTSGVQSQLNAKTPELYTFAATTGTTKTIATADAFKSLKFTDSGAITVTVPTHASDAIPVGTYVELYQWGGQITVVAETPATTSIRSTDSQTKSRTTYSAMVLIKVDENEWLLTGDLTA